MIIAGEYSFNGGREFIEEHFSELLAEVKEAIHSINAWEHKTKEAAEKTRAGRVLYSPSSLNIGFKENLHPKGWINKKEMCEYPTQYYLDGYQPKEEDKLATKAYRDMDFVKNKLGVEVQFGKYSFMVYNVCAKMTIFHKKGHIEAGIEIVPVKQLAEEMSTGVSYFEQFVWDLEQRGVSDLDIPVLIIGIDDDYAHKDFGLNLRPPIKIQRELAKEAKAKANELTKAAQKAEREAKAQAKSLAAAERKAAKAK